jgi:hypothetical protein
MIFHILAPKPRGTAGNKFYRAGEYPKAKTLCGTEPTRYDIRFGWQAFAAGNYEPCVECIAIREQSKKSAKVTA